MRDFLRPVHEGGPHAHGKQDTHPRRQVTGSRVGLERPFRGGQRSGGKLRRRGAHGDEPQPQRLPRRQRRVQSIVEARGGRQAHTGQQAAQTRLRETHHVRPSVEAVAIVAMDWQRVEPRHAEEQDTTVA